MDSVSKSNNEVKQLGLFSIILLHLVPGLVAVLVFIFSAPYMIQSGLPAVFALFLGLLVSFILIFVFLLYQGYQKSGKISLSGIILNREKVKTTQFFLFIPILIVSSLIIGGILAPLNDMIMNKFFSWLPEWFWWTKQFLDLESLSTPVLIALFIIVFIGNAIIGPVVEEVYFRGYLLPRMKRYGRWAPLLNVFLFSIYHFFSPEQNITRVFILTPVIYTVWWKKNIYFSILTHCTINVVPSILVLSVLLGRI